MSNTITPFSKQLTLIRREFQEQRLGFILVPVCSVVLAAFAFGFYTIRSLIVDSSPIVFLGGGVQGQEESAADSLDRLAAAPLEIREGVWEQFYLAPSSLLIVMFWMIMIFYFMMTLYQQRKDRSILFWNSMPVSNTQTVLSKVLAGLVFAQAGYLVCMLAIQLIFLLILCSYALFFDVDIWNTFIAPSNILSRFFWYVLYLLVNVFWCLPVYGWFLLISARVKSAPFAWAGAPLVVLIVPELVLYERSRILDTFLFHVSPGWVMDPRVVDGLEKLNRVLTAEFLISALLGITFVYAAIRLNRSEDL